MQDHKKLIDWYIQREVKAAKKNPMHGRIFLDRILDNPQDEVEMIKVTLPQDIIEASHDLGRTPMINYRTFPRALVTAYRKDFLGIEE